MYFYLTTSCMRLNYFAIYNKIIIEQRVLIVKFNYRNEFLEIKLAKSSKGRWKYSQKLNCKNLNKSTSVDCK